MASKRGVTRTEPVQFSAGPACADYGHMPFENILESSTEYSIIGKDLDGKILLWNEGARRLYGYAPEEVVGKANSAILHTPEDVASGKPRQMLEPAIRQGHWEGTIARVRREGQQFMARVVVTPRRVWCSMKNGAEDQNQTRHAIRVGSARG